MNRSIREALAAAREVFEGVGWFCEFDDHGKHPAVVVTPPGENSFRFSLCNTPSRGPTGAAKLALWNARKIVRQHAGAR